MIALDLKLVLIIGILVIVSLIAIAVLIDRRLTRRSRWNAELRPAFDGAPFGIMLLNQTSLLYANQGARRLLTLLPDTGPLPNVATWRDALLADLLSARQTAAGSSYRIFSLSDDQHISWTIFPLDDEQNSLAFVLDLSQQRKLESASRLFLNTLSHELRTPLTAILAHIEVLRRADTPASVQDVSLNLIHQETHRLARLVQDLLTLGRLETIADINERPINVLLLIEDAISEIFPLAEARQLSLSLEADSPLNLIQGSEDYLKQAILNLLDNALKYCRPGDEIKVTVKNDAKGILCCIADTGPGIAPEHLPHLTRRFYRVNKSVEGTGLGLALVHEILRRHHSELKIESNTDGTQTGTSFCFTLPKIVEGSV
jgi:two-component system phosphate regulon sensor histidine kinase PhoR